MTTNMYFYFNGYTEESMEEEQVKNMVSDKNSSVKMTVSKSLGAISVRVYSHVVVDCQCYKCAPRALYTIARNILCDWNPVWFGAVPYLSAMQSLDNCKDNYGMDSGKSIVLYFLSNAATWKGLVAKSIKAELKYMAK